MDDLANPSVTPTAQSSLKAPAIKRTPSTFDTWEFAKPLLLVFAFYAAWVAFRYAV